jgi:hypothetical protein
MQRRRGYTGGPVTVVSVSKYQKGNVVAYHIVTCDTEGLLTIVNTLAIVKAVMNTIMPHIPRMYSFFVTRRSRNKHIDIFTKARATTTHTW